jgi:hypothetical protein
MDNTFFVWPIMAVHLIILTYLTQLIFDKPIVCIIFILYNKIVVSVELLGHYLALYVIILQYLYHLIGIFKN